jgi:Fe-S-cluster-containing hydrogenase component 2
MKGLNRRELFLGRWLKSDFEAEPNEAQHDAMQMPDRVAEILAESRMRAPWEKAAAIEGDTSLAARILTFDCLCHLGTICTSCVERCPAAGAIVMTEGIPAIDGSKCTGCGDCVVACPAPHTAIVLGPRHG